MFSLWTVDLGCTNLHFGTESKASYLNKRALATWVRTTEEEEEEEEEREEEGEGEEEDKEEKVKEEED